MRSLIEQAQALRSGEVSPVEVVEASLDAIERSQPVHNAFTVVLREDAIARAKESLSGPLAGVPVAVKDMYDVAGVATTGCCAAYHDRVAATDSAVVARLRAAGAIIVGKTNQHELAVGGTTQVSSFGPAWNPWDTTRVTGGSSGGSAAAVAAGLVPMAIGSDSLGSIRIPSSWCGTTGLKPTHGAISLRGALPMIASFDTAGPIARTAADCGLVFELLAGYDAEYPASVRAPAELPAVRGRVAIARKMFSYATTDVRCAVENAASAFASAGIAVDEIDGPDPDVAWSAAVPFWTEYGEAYRDLWGDERVSSEPAFLLNVAEQITGIQLAEAIRIRRDVRRTFANAFENYDALLCPATPFVAPHAHDEVIECEGGRLDVRTGCARFTAAANVAGLPALSFPVGVDPAGIPIGAQLIGPAWSERTLVGLGERYQSATDWHTRSPA